MLSLDLKKYCEINGIVFNPMFTSSGGKLLQNGYCEIGCLPQYVNPNSTHCMMQPSVNRYIIYYMSAHLPKG